MDKILERICKFLFKPKIVNSMLIRSNLFAREHVLEFKKMFCRIKGKIRLEVIRYSITLTLFRDIKSGKRYVDLIIQIKDKDGLVHKDLNYNLETWCIREISYSLYSFMTSDQSFNRVMSKDEIYDIIEELSSYIEEHVLPM